MDPINVENLLQVIRKDTDCEPEVYPEIKSDVTIRIPSASLKSVVDVFLENFDYCHLSAITAQQRDAQSEEIEVLYNFWVGQSLSLMLTLSTKSMKLPSIIATIPGADFYEREVAEMFGVEFTGRKETPPLLLPDDWDQGPPFLSSEENDG